MECVAKIKRSANPGTTCLVQPQLNFQLHDLDGCLVLVVENLSWRGRSLVSVTGNGIPPTNASGQIRGIVTVLYHEVFDIGKFGALFKYHVFLSDGAKKPWTLTAGIYSAGQSRLLFSGRGQPYWPNPFFESFENSHPQFQNRKPLTYFRGHCAHSLLRARSYRRHSR